MQDLSHLYSKAVFNDAKDIFIFVALNENFKKKVENIENKYIGIDIKKGITNLRNIERTLFLAYAGSKGFPCSVEIKNMLENYQTLIKKSISLNTSFAESCITAISEHQKALRFILEGGNLVDEKQSYHKAKHALSLITKSSLVAHKMEVDMQNLCDSLSHFIEMTCLALVSAANDEDNSTHKYLDSMYNSDTAAKESNSLVASIVSLNLTLKALGKIRIIFESVRHYCLCIKDQCTTLKRVFLEADIYLEHQEYLLEEILDSGIIWLALGKINFTSLQAMNKSNANTFHVKNLLPTKEEAIQIIKQEAQAIISLIIE